jgi:spore germination protein (amino acid permease)
MSLGNKIFVSNFQMIVMVCSIISFSNMLSIPMELTKVSHQDAWISYFLSIPYGFFIALLLFVLMRRMPGKNLYEISTFVCGKWIGGFLNVLLILYLFYDLVVNLRLYSDYMNSSILLRTPVEYILLLTVSILFFFGNGSIVYVARSAVVFFSIFLFVYLFQPLMMLNEIDVKLLLPALSRGISLPFRGGVLGMGSFGDIIALGAFLNYMKSPRGLYVSIKCGVAISVLMLTIWTLLIITTLGHTAASRIIYIGWILVQIIHITSFLDRVDLFIISLWLPNIIIKYCILYLAILTGIASFTRTKNYKPFNLLTCGLVILTAIVLFSNVGEVIKLYNYGMIPVSILVQVLFFGIVFIALLFKKTKPIRDQWMFGRSVWIALLGCGISIGISGVLGNYRGIYGQYCATFYFLCLLAVVFLSVREFNKLPDLI